MGEIERATQGQGWSRWRSRDGVERVWERQQHPSGRQEQQGKPEAGLSGTVWDLSWNQIGQGNSGHLVTFTLEARPSHSSLDPGLGDPSLVL